MKKIISIILVAVMLLSFAACTDNSDGGTKADVSYADIDTEALKSGWKDGALVFANGESVSIPCTVAEFLDASGLSLENADVISAVSLDSDESKSISVVNDETDVRIVCTNKTEEEINITEATIVQYTLNNTKPGNRKIAFAGALTMRANCDDVVEALGEPSKTTEDGSVYYYSGRNSKNKKIELRIGFNSDNAVASVTYEIT